MGTHFGLHIVKNDKFDDAQDVAARLFLCPRISTEHASKMLDMLIGGTLSVNAFISKTDSYIEELSRRKEIEDYIPHIMNNKLEAWCKVFKSPCAKDYKYLEKTFGFSKKDLFGEDKQDATNVWNEFQGSFRYGYFEEDRFRNVCNQEFKKAKRMYPYTKLSFAFTHADETDGMVLESSGHKEIKDVVSPLSPDCFYTSIGNTRQHVIETPLKTHRKSQ